MQVECIKPFGTHVPGDVAEVPDGASVDPVHWRPVARPDPPADSVAGLLGGLAGIVATPAKEGM